MVDKYSIITWLKSQWNFWFAGVRSNHKITDMQYEREVGRIALHSIQVLIKMKHLKKHSDEHHRVFLMDGNADNYMELDDVVLDKEDEYLVTTAKRLLKYGG